MLKFLSTYRFVWAFTGLFIFTLVGAKYFGFWMDTAVPLGQSVVATVQTPEKNPCSRPAISYLIRADKQLEKADNPASLYHAAAASSLMQMYEICSHMQKENETR